MFVDKCPKLIENLFKFDTMLKEEQPELSAHMEENGVMVNSCFAHYFLTLCCQNVPIEFSKRIMDMFLYNGEQVLFDVLLKIVTTTKDDAMKLVEEKLFAFFKNDIMDICFENYKRELSKLIPA